jgi:hypothetical protein
LSAVERLFNDFQKENAMQYRTTTQIKHDGISYPPGELIDLSNEEAAKLLESDAVERVDLPFSGVLKTPWGDVK